MNVLYGIHHETNDNRANSIQDVVMTGRWFLLLTIALGIGLGQLVRQERLANATARVAPLVPLEFARERGAKQWDPVTIQSFLADRKNQIRLHPSAIQAREGRGPSQWLPSTGQCDYMGRFMAVMQRYQLHHQDPDWSSLLTRRQRCYTQFQ